MYFSAAVELATGKFALDCDEHEEIAGDREVEVRPTFLVRTNVIDFQSSSSSSIAFVLAVHYCAFCTG